MNYSLSIKQSIFDKLPNLRVLVFHLKDATLADESACTALLSKGWTSARATIAPLPNAQSHPLIDAWRQAYKALGVPTKKYTASIENLVKRASKADSVPRSICPLVDFYNGISLLSLIPFGGFDLADPTAHHMTLRFTEPGDTFHALDGKVAEAIPVEEAAYASGKTVLTRHINWKQSREGLISQDTKEVVFMAEILGSVPQEAFDQLVDLIKESCQIILQLEPVIHILDASNLKLEY